MTLRLKSNIGDTCTITMAFDGRINIVDIDEDERTVVFDLYRSKKITGTRVGAILGQNEFTSPFKVACEMAGLYPGDKDNKYLEAGNVCEPIIRKYVRTKCIESIAEDLGLQDGKVPVIEEPVDREQCGYDHFHNNKVFGGLVDGYVSVDGRRTAVLEIKTASDRTKWLDEEGNVTQVPKSYMLQASLYAELSNLDKIVFAVSFLNEEDYDRPRFWTANEENTHLLVVDKLDMEEPMRECEAWYKEYILGGYTPEWSDSESDQEVLKYLKSYKPDKKGRR